MLIQREVYEFQLGQQIKAMAPGSNYLIRLINRFKVKRFMHYASVEWAQTYVEPKEGNSHCIRLSAHHPYCDYETFLILEVSGDQSNIIGKSYIEATAAKLCVDLFKKWVLINNT